jgi:type IV pilus assembly protein PilO
MSAERFVADIQAQFSGLNFKDIPAWQGLPRMLVILVAVIACLGGWYTQLFTPDVEALDAAKAKELDLRNQLQSKFNKAATLQLLRDQSKEAQEKLKKLDSLLPPSEEIPQVLSQVNRLGYTRDLRFELFQPEVAMERDGFGMVPVKVQMKGGFRDLSNFIGDVALQKRLMMFDEMRLAFQPTGDVLMDGKLLAFRQPGGGRNMQGGR